MSVTGIASRMRRTIGGCCEYPRDEAAHGKRAFQGGRCVLKFGPIQKLYLIKH